MTSANSETPPAGKFCSSCGRRLGPQDRFCDGCGARQTKTDNINPRGHFSELLKVEGKLALREPYGVFGVVFPVGLLVLFAWISSQEPGNVANTGLTVLELYIPTIMVIGFTVIAMGFLPNVLVRDREIGWLRRVSTTPVPPSRLLGAQLIINLAFASAMVLIASPSSAQAMAPVAIQIHGSAEISAGFFMRAAGR